MVKAIPVGAVTSGAEEFSDDIYGFDCFQGAPDFLAQFSPVFEDECAIHFCRG
jgi:hypothetical protein